MKFIKRETVLGEKRRQNVTITWFGLEANVHKEIPLMAHYTESGDTMNPNAKPLTNHTINRD